MNSWSAPADYRLGAIYFYFVFIAYRHNNMHFLYYVYVSTANHNAVVHVSSLKCFFVYQRALFSLGGGVQQKIIALAVLCSSIHIMSVHNLSSLSWDTRHFVANWIFGPRSITKLFEFLIKFIAACKVWLAESTIQIPLIRSPVWVKISKVKFNTNWYVNNSNYRHNHHCHY